MKFQEMPMWTWIAIAVGGFFVLSTAVALALARTLGVIAREISALYEVESWAELPLSREADVQTQSAPAATLPAEESRERSVVGLA
jgi:hypothetical protein